MVFVAKSEVARWPVFGWLAKLQRTDLHRPRRRRHKTGAATQEIADRLLGGDAVVLFAEGTSSDGNRVLPFRSALIGAVHHALGNSTQHTSVTVQPMSLAYVGFGGLPIGRALRERVAWYGDADLMPHFIGVLASGAIDVTVSWGEAVAYDMTRGSQDDCARRRTGGAADDHRGVARRPDQARGAIGRHRAAGSRRLKAARPP